ncbi:class III lanthionine synthetase LanKC N-terminal domain-containing protein [Oceanirhabdus sp. W0125-5]|uniref:class III lanthionine synthetase LanKC N-terminal domain-containing protein n=1 Tax=Oceanirhabdus sp. W0125-5 TaxID=2999116 RepID=UPI0022F2ED0F|nr:lanthionine synthetase LanC family protein [Oceanirhabdus sp. W0125-5]WBW97575.1 protein kinase [Oceanirhabdus sp. W0125-5]
MKELYFQNILNRFDEKDILTEKIYSLIPETWNIIDENPWLMSSPKNNKLPFQGWKGHISVILRDAMKIADIAIPILVKNQCSFKIVKSSNLLSVINDVHFPVSGANKYITFYPSSENKFKECIYELYDALKNFKGPRIHTDFQCGINGLVHFRYGAFIKMTKYDTEKNKIIHCIKNNKGELVEDERNPWYQKPDWVKDPFDNINNIFSNTLNLSEQEIKKINEFEFLSILSRANKGNVYLAKVRSTGKEVIIKESNPYVCIGSKSSDLHETLKNEYNILKIMQNTGCVPEVYELFNCGNKCYMVEEKVIGDTMLKYAQSNHMSNYNEKIKLVHKLINYVQLFHDNGYILRDLKPNNFIITRDLNIKFIDLETVCLVNSNQNAYFVGTDGFYNPEFDFKNLDLRNDWFATIITIISLMLGTIPYFNHDLMKGLPGERKVMSKLVGYIEILVNNGDLKNEEYQLIIDIINNKINSSYNYLLLENKEAMKNASFSYIVDSAIESFYKQCEIAYHTHEKRLWKCTEFGDTINGFNIQHGIAGVGQFLIEYIKNNNKNNEFAQKTLLIISKYIKENIKDFMNCIKDEENGTSFLFGSHGISWFMYDLGMHLKDDEIINYSRILSDIPSNNDCLDFALGEAGRAYTELKLWLSTGDTIHYNKAMEGINTIVNQKEDLKTVHANHIEKINTHGFAHGYAGIAYVTYIASLINNNDCYKEYALNKVDLIIDFCENLFKSKDNKISISWCNGLAGISLALVRINQFEKNKKITEILNKVPQILIDRMLYQSPCQCHGNSSSIEFLMDAYQITGDISFYKAAKKIATFVSEQFFYGKNNSIRFPNETKISDVYDYGVGTIGVIQALNRVDKKIAKRLFIIDETELLTKQSRVIVNQNEY